MSTTQTPPASAGASPGDRAGMLERPLSRVLRPDAEGHRLRGRPDLYTAYKQDMALLNTPAKRNWTLLFGIAVVAGAFVLSNDIVTVLAIGLAYAIGAIGMNIVTGYAGQVSLGHAFFVGIGIYTAAVMSGDPESRLLGYGIDFAPLWLLTAGVVAAFFGLLVAPLALRLKGLYLAIVTLGLVFVGDHIFREARFITGGFGVGREGAVVSFGFGRFDVDGEILGLTVTRAQRMYLLCLVVLVIAAIVGRNIARSDLGRAFAAVRDRDVAAEVIGVDLTRAKILAFVISSFYAGVCGALLFTVTGFVEPASLSLLLSVRFLAMILIGGVATISGSIMGAMFIAALPRISLEIAKQMPSGIGLNEQIIEGILSGALIVAFLILEPRGLYGLWFRIRNYWKAWPFSY